MQATANLPIPQALPAPVTHLQVATPTAAERAAFDAAYEKQRLSLSHLQR